MRRRRYKFACGTLLLILLIILLAYTKHKTTFTKHETTALIETFFAEKMPFREFPYQNACAINFTLDASYFGNNTPWQMLEKELACNLEPGGRYKPETYVAQNDIVVVIPYRNREEQLKIFMRYMHPYLQRKQLAYRIVVVEMTPRQDFNRGLLFNVGFVETIKVTDHQCFIFHDVDLLPQNINTPYSCERSPLHMAAAIDKLDYKMPYENFFGGICAVKKTHFQRINGLSNQYFGWGNEDDDFHSRLILSQLPVNRLSRNEGQYHMLPHSVEKQNPYRNHLFKTMKDRRSVDGLNSLKYQIVKSELKPLYTWILVDVNTTYSEQFGLPNSTQLTKGTNNNNS